LDSAVELEAGSGSSTDMELEWLSKVPHY